MQKLDPSKIPGSVEVSLSDGIKISIRRPKVKDKLMVSHIKDEGEQEVALIANLTMKTKDDIADIWWDDYLLIQKTIQSFLSPQKKKPLD